MGVVVVKINRMQEKRSVEQESGRCKMDKYSIVVYYKKDAKDTCTAEDFV